ncbi:hypothetical protein AJ80_07691 [Polytolypa hystricis UAMH7299]|uniref:Ketoreductase domain-containing protein n=1 Tax=Polytolypa hystricis (strain UAMH7299) TaxID=1447883 RepID=A0A2B7XJT0_POLH7|nr:hypothetical protein AJ80_07691 [Polytolypa hystricis UAMH7299]
MAPPKVWLITGCSTGFGHELALQALQRGEKVIATARNISKLNALKEAGAATLQLDVTANLDPLKKVAEMANGIHGRIDVLVNNAAFVVDGPVEETTPEETQSIFSTNVFGLLNMIRAITPYMRAQRSGIIANFSSIGGWGGFPGCALYTATKWAVSGISESLVDELKPFGITVTCIEPGYFRSDLLTASNRKSPQIHIADYDGTPGRETMDLLDAVNRKQPGDIVKGCKVLLDILTQSGVAGGREIPIRVALGPDSAPFIEKKCQETIKLVGEWKDVTVKTNHDDVKE